MIEGDAIIEWQLQNIEKISKANAEYQKNSELAKTIFSMCKLKHDGSNADRETKARVDPEYRKFIDETKFNSDLEWRMIEAEWKTKEAKLGWIRSKLKYINEANGNTL